jgi:hypothetical protein
MNHCFDAPHVVEDILKIWARVGVEARRLKVHEPATDLGHGADYPLKADQFLAQSEESLHLRAAEEVVESASLHF